MSPNREISMAPVSVMPRLGFWSSINAPGRSATLFGLCLPCRYVEKFEGSDIDFATMRQGFEGMWWCAMLCARVLKKLFVAFARLAAMCKGFKGNVQLLPICARALRQYRTMCGNVQGF